MLYVDAAADDCQVGNGSQQTPFCTVTEAFEAIDTQGNALPFSVHIAGFAGLYIETLSVPATYTIALVGPEGGLEAWLSSSQGDTLTMTGAPTSLYIRDLHIDNTAGQAGIDCTDGNLWVDGGGFQGIDDYQCEGLRATGCDATLRDVTFEELGYGVQSTGGSVWLERLNLMDGTSGYLAEGINTQITASEIQTLHAGFRVEGGSLDLSNSFLINSLNPGGVTGDDNAEISISYTTLIHDPNTGAPPFNQGLECLSVSSVTVRNSIIVGDEPPSVDCAEAVIDNSVLDSAHGQGSGNVDLQPADWSSVFLVPGTNFHVLADSLPKDVAIWRTGDPEADIDGDPRPTVDMTPDYAGADVP
jgi:hypothetical protein